jgi:hypothetical protein
MDYLILVLIYLPDFINEMASITKEGMLKQNQHSKMEIGLAMMKNS